MKVLTEKITNILSDSVGEEEDIKFLGSMVGRVFTKPILDNLLVVDDDVFFSVGHLEYEGEDHFLSLGVFGHVFTVSKEQVKRRMKQNKD